MLRRPFGTERPASELLSGLGRTDRRRSCGSADRPGWPWSARCCSIPCSSPFARAFGLTTGTVAIEQAIASRNRWRVGDHIAVQVRDTPRTPLTVAAIIDTTKVSGLLRGARALGNIDTVDRLDPVHLDQVLYVRATNRSVAQTAALEDRISAAVGVYPTVEVGNLASYRRLIEQQVSPFIAFLFVLLGISVVIAAIGVANTMKLSIAERTRELGLLRAVGMDRGQARAMVR